MKLIVTIDYNIHDKIKKKYQRYSKLYEFYEFLKNMSSRTITIAILTTIIKVITIYLSFAFLSLLILYYVLTKIFLKQ